MTLEPCCNTKVENCIMLLEGHNINIVGTYGWGRSLETNFLGVSCILPWTSLCLRSNRCVDEKSVFDRRKSPDISKYPWGVETDHQSKRD